MEIIKLNLIPSGVNPTCHCSQYDNGRVIRIELFDGLTPYVLQSGDTVTLNVRKPDNTIVTASVTATQGNNYVDIVTTEQICACVGYNLCDLTITNGSKVIGTLNFIMQIERDVLADGNPSQSVIEDLDELVQEAVGDNYYTKGEVDDALDLKANQSTTYSKTETDSLVSNSINDIVADIPSETFGKPNYYEGYYISRTGELVADADFCTSEKIPCKDFFTSCTFYYGTNTAPKINLCSFQEDGTFIDFWGGVSSEMRSISDLGTNAAYVQFSYPKTYTTPKLTNSRGFVYWASNHTSIITNTVIGKNPPIATEVNSGNMSANSIVKLDVNALKPQTLIFYCKFSDFVGISIGHGSNGATYTEYVKIDNTNIYVYTAGTSGSGVAHNLTISEYLAVMLNVKDNCDWSITLHTLGGSYTRNFTYPNAWLGYKETIFVKNKGSTITKYNFNFVAPYQRNKWIFGDSYLSNYSSARWPYYLHQYGYDYSLINAFPGENSSEAYIDWISALLHGNPKYAIWCLGMNDPDNNNSINASWLSTIQKFIADCNKRGVTPILATIPNVPNILHTYKNAWVKSSGYRYIDFAEAVGAEAANSTWYDGCLETSSPRIHPTENGARLLFMRALSDFPEFMQD